MKNVIKMVIFIIYTILLFCIKDFLVLFYISIFQLVLMFINNISIKQASKNILYLMPFILFTVLINLIAMEKEEALLIGIRLILVCNITYIYGKTTTARKISNAIENLLYPLKLFKVNTRNIGIIISIAITLIPILHQEIENIKYSLIGKGFNMSFLNQITHINYLMKPLFYSILRKVNEMESALLSKGYVG